MLELNTRYFLFYLRNSLYRLFSMLSKIDRNMLKDPPLYIIIYLNYYNLFNITSDPILNT
jgi:hypothetical protein